MTLFWLPREGRSSQKAMTAALSAPADVPFFALRWGSLKTKEDIMKTRDQTAKIAELNDLCRTAMGMAGRLV